MADLRPPDHSIPKLARNEGDAALSPERYRLSLIKGEHRWQFRWEPGSESQLIDRIANLAAQPDAPLDWYDAAVICRHIAQPFSGASSDGPKTAA